MSGRPSSALGNYSVVPSTPSLIPRRTSTSGVTATAPLSRSTGAGGGGTGSLGVLGQTGLPTPGPGVSGSTAAVNRTLKRSSNQAGLPMPGSTLKRPHVQVPSTPSNKLTSLRHDLEASSSAASLQRQLSTSQRENGQLMREVGAMQERVKQLEKERAVLMSREEKVTTRDSERDQRSEEERRTLVASLGEFRQRYAVLEEENDSLLRDFKRMKHEHELMADQRDNAHGQLEALQEELQRLDEAKQELKASEDALQEAHDKIANLEKQGAQTSTDSTSIQRSPDVSEVLRKELHHQVQHLRTLEQNNARLTREVETLKKDKANVELLKEEKLSLESKLRRMDALRRNLTETEGEVAILQRERDEWAVYLKSAQAGDEKFETPAQLAKSLASARIELASLNEKLQSSAATLKSRDDLISQLEGRVHELEKEIIPLLRQESDSAKRQLDNIVRMRKLDQMELDMLREQIQSYAIEESQLMASTTSAESDVKPNIANYESQKSLQIQHLQRLLDNQKEESGRLTVEVQQLHQQLKESHTQHSTALSSTGDASTARSLQLQSSLSQQIAQNDELREALRLTQMELAELQTEVESLDNQLDVLQQALGRGEYNMGTTKVLSLRDNPADADFAIRSETLDRLKEENRVLLEKLADAEKHAQTTSGELIRAADKDKTLDNSDTESVPKQTFVNLQAENTELLLKIEQGEKARNRLREVFQKTARELRDACKLLLGYTVEPAENGRMKLTTVFGGSDYQLVFGPDLAKGSNNRKLQLVGGNEAFITSPRVQQGLNFWVAERGCLPGFLASMTLELFEESTRGRTVGYTESH